jgi:hypothetical protein
LVVKVFHSFEETPRVEDDLHARWAKCISLRCS